jgi:hypothetical protein
MVAHAKALHLAKEEVILKLLPKPCLKLPSRELQGLIVLTFPLLILPMGLFGCLARTEETSCVSASAAQDRTKVSKLWIGRKLVQRKHDVH